MASITGEKALRCFQLTENINKLFLDELVPTKITMEIHEASEPGVHTSLEVLTDKILDYYEHDGRFGKKERIIGLLKQSGLFQ